MIINLVWFYLLGKQGTGKTYSSVAYVIEEKLNNDYIIITNVSSFKTFTDTIYEPDIFKVIEISKKLFEEKKKFLIFFDEIFTVLEKSGSLCSEILSFISQLRKRQVIFVSTAQEWSEINISFRRYCRFQVACNMFALPFSKTALVVNKINDGYQIKWDNDLQEFVAPTIRTNFSKGEKRIIEQYDTFETIKIGKLINRR